jgi:mRNA-degrading endonuclease RelE of RelBE toxin-antitoxin system
VRVVLNTESRADFGRLPSAVKARVLKVIDRLRKYPQISGIKWLTGSWAGHGRIRTGDWRIVFYVVRNVIIVRVQHRREIYDE